MHDDDVKPSVLPYRPNGQAAVHAALESPAVDPYVPAGQEAVQVADDKPLMAPYSPALQFVQNPEPATLYVPGKHMDAEEFVDPAGQLYPALQGPSQTDVVRPDVEPN